VPLISVPGPASAQRLPRRRPRRPGRQRAGDHRHRRAADHGAGGPGESGYRNRRSRRSAGRRPGRRGANALVLTVREDAWIEVRPAKGGTPMIKRLVKAGSTETVNVDQPVRVIVGNPGSVSASLRGAPVALPPGAGQDVLAG
jgi:cytoskeleton protein RodZ